MVGLSRRKSANSKKPVGFTQQKTSVRAEVGLCIKVTLKSHQIIKKLKTFLMLLGLKIISQDFPHIISIYRMLSIKDIALLCIL